MTKTGAKLREAAERGDLDALQMELDNGASIDDATMINGENALHIGAAKGLYDIVEELLERGADVDKPTKLLGRTPLQLASQHGHAEVVQLLLEYDADKSITSHTGETARDLAESSEIRDALNDVPGVVDGRDLRAAALAGEYDVVTKELDRGAPIDQGDGDGNTALHCACSKGHLSVVLLLLERGALIDKQNGTGWTALMMAVDNSKISVVNVLLEYGADRDRRTEDGMTAIDWARDDEIRKALKAPRSENRPPLLNRSGELSVGSARVQPEYPDPPLKSRTFEGFSGGNSEGDEGDSSDDEGDLRLASW